MRNGMHSQKHYLLRQFYISNNDNHFHLGADRPPTACSTGINFGEDKETDLHTIARLYEFVN